MNFQSFWKLQTREILKSFLRVKDGKWNSFTPSISLWKTIHMPGPGDRSENKVDVIPALTPLTTGTAE